LLVVVPRAMATIVPAVILGLSPPSVLVCCSLKVRSPLSSVTSKIYTSDPIPLSNFLAIYLVITWLYAVLN